jgi:hypothetical protein
MQICSVHCELSFHIFSRHFTFVLKFIRIKFNFISWIVPLFKVNIKIFYVKFESKNKIIKNTRTRAHKYISVSY